MKPVIAVLRRQGIRCTIFLDDLLLLSHSKQELEEITRETLLFLEHLGFLANMDKSVLEPTQRTVYLDFTIDSRNTTLSLPIGKLKAIIRDCRQVLNCSYLTIRDVVRLIGRMSAASQAILPAPLFYRGLQNLKNTAF